MGAFDNRTPTRAYATAVYAYDQAILSGGNASIGGVETLAKRIDEECYGLIAGAPGNGTKTSSSSARQIGEEVRRTRQTADLEEELAATLAGTARLPYRQATTEFVSAIKHLRWSDRSVTLLVGELAEYLERTLSSKVPDVCEDIKAWAASGYKTLSPASREFQREDNGIAHVSVNARSASLSTAQGMLVRYQKRYASGLLVEIEALRPKFTEMQKRLGEIASRLQSELGFKAFGESFQEVSHTGGVIFGHRQTASGGAYRVRLEKNVEEPGGPGGKGHCRISLTILDSEGESAVGCVTQGAHVPAGQSVNCDAGHLVIAAVTLPATQKVRLELTEGKQITSSVVRAPATLGGGRSEDGLYFQVVRGPRPVPLRLVELNASGKTLKALKLQRVVECTKNPLKFLPKGIQPLAHGRIRGGPGFLISGEAYRFLGSIHFALKVKTQNSGGGSSLSGKRPKVLEKAVWSSCNPRPYAIVYGVLHKRGDVVLARVAAGLVTLKKASIPAHLHAHGSLVYAALSEVPSAIVVRDGKGKTLFDESLGSEPRSARELCEGESENGSG